MFLNHLIPDFNKQIPSCCDNEIHSDWVRPFQFHNGNIHTRTHKYDQNNPYSIENVSEPSVPKQCTRNINTRDQITNIPRSMFPYSTDPYFCFHPKYNWPLSPFVIGQPPWEFINNVEYTAYETNAESIACESSLTNNIKRMQLRGIETLEHIVSNNIPVVFAPNVPDNCVLKPISQVFYNIICQNKIQDISKIYAYIDGGYSPIGGSWPMSWGFIVVLEDSCGMIAPLCCAGGVVSDQWKLFCTHNNPSSFVAEVYANIIVLIFLCNLSKDLNKYTNLKCIRDCFVLCV